MGLGLALCAVGLWRLEAAAGGGSLDVDDQAAAVVEGWRESRLPPAARLLVFVVSDGLEDSGPRRLSGWRLARALLRDVARSMSMVESAQSRTMPANVLVLRLPAILWARDRQRQLALLASAMGRARAAGGRVAVVTRGREAAALALAALSASRTQATRFVALAAAPAELPPPPVAIGDFICAWSDGGPLMEDGWSSGSWQTSAVNVSGDPLEDAGEIAAPTRLADLKPLAVPAGPGSGGPSTAAALAGRTALIARSPAADAPRTTSTAQTSLEPGLWEGDWTTSGNEALKIPWNNGATIDNHVSIWEEGGHSRLACKVVYASSWSKCETAARGRSLMITFESDEGAPPLRCAVDQALAGQDGAPIRAAGGCQDNSKLILCRRNGCG